VPTARVRRRCQQCGCRVVVRLDLQAHTDHRVWCEACLAARVAAVQAEREAPRTCPRGHLLTPDNVSGQTGSGRRRVRCRTCRKAERQA
jgi:hypothetical protein